MTLYVIRAVTIIDSRLENLNLLSGDLGAFQPTKELFRLPAEHAATDDLYATWQ